MANLDWNGQNEIISHIQYYRWGVLGVKNPKKKNNQFKDCLNRLENCSEKNLFRNQRLFLASSNKNKIVKYIKWHNISIKF